MKLNARERTIAARNRLLFEDGRARVKTGSGKTAIIEPNYMNINRQYFSAYTIDDELNHKMICTRATLETALRKIAES